MSLALRSLVQTCGACPSQWEGETVDGRAVYVRYRWGYLSMGVGRTLDDAIDASFSNSETFGAAIGGGYDGVMSTQEMAERIGLVLP